MKLKRIDKEDRVAVRAILNAFVDGKITENELDKFDEWKFNSSTYDLVCAIAMAGRVYDGTPEDHLCHIKKSRKKKDGYDPNYRNNDSSNFVQYQGDDGMKKNVNK